MQTASRDDVAASDDACVFAEVPAGDEGARGVASRLSHDATDPRELKLHRDQPQRDVPYLPTDAPVVEAMMRFAGVNEHDVFYDLGCGDGRLVIAAAKRGARAIGVDIDLQRIHECHENCSKACMRHRATFIRGSFFDLDLRDATIVMTYLLPAINKRLIPKFQWELKPGTRIISNYFDMGDWQPDQQIYVHHRTLLKWIVPAWVQGTWRCVIDRPRDRAHMRLELHRHNQFVWGTAHIGRSKIPVMNGRLLGDQLTFTLSHPWHAYPRQRFMCRVEDHVVRGTVQAAGAVGPGSPATAWGGVREGDWM
jgi:precorrin-6B methylase 2